MEDTASPKLIELRFLYSGLDELSSMLHLTAIPADLDLDVRVCQDHMQTMMRLCEITMDHLRVSMGIKPNLLDIFKLWERGDLSNEIVALVERSTGIRSTEFKEAKSIFESIDVIKQDMWNLFKVFQWKYAVVVILLEWKRTLPQY